MVMLACLSIIAGSHVARFWRTVDRAKKETIIVENDEMSDCSHMFNR